MNARCIEKDVPSGPLWEEDGFIAHVYNSMCDNADDYPMPELVELICDGGAVERLFHQYRKGLR